MNDRTTKKGAQSNPHSEKQMNRKTRTHLLAVVQSIQGKSLSPSFDQRETRNAVFQLCEVCAELIKATKEE
jgi:hypothetical protein